MQTIEEAGKERYPFKLDGAAEALRDCFKSVVDFAQHWIDVDIEIADLGITVIFQFVHVKYPKKMIYSTGYFDEKGVPILDYDIDDCNDYDVTHWRPINLI